MTRRNPKDCPEAIKSCGACLVLHVGLFFRPCIFLYNDGDKKVKDGALFWAFGDVKPSTFVDWEEANDAIISSIIYFPANLERDYRIVTLLDYELYYPARK